mmetsp:Transcript_61329/g.134272  ORF Transcript_61329/g.134272 Transcript_61329/m.134272 type:complete len:80 (-) Transcript_61329:359-598(-)
MQRIPELLWKKKDWSYTGIIGCFGIVPTKCTQTSVLNQLGLRQYLLELYLERTSITRPLGQAETVAANLSSEQPFAKTM